MGDKPCSSGTSALSSNPVKCEIEKLDLKLSSECGGTAIESPHTVLRLKRRIDEDPAQVLLLSFKRCKGEDGYQNGEVGKSGLVRHVLKLAGTLTSDQTETSVAETISQALASKCESGSGAVKPSLKTRPNKLLVKSRSKFQKTIVENRFRLISTKRGLDIQEDANVSTEELGDPSIIAAVQDLYNLYDLVKDDVAEEAGSQTHDQENKEASIERAAGSITCNGLPMLSETKKRTRDAECEESESKKAREEKAARQDPNYGYVYDLYITNEAIDNSIQDQRVSVQDMKDIYGEEFFGEELFAGEGNESGDEAESRMEDEDDSNEEDNWRYEYPSDDPDADEDEEKGSDSDGEEMDVEGELAGLRSRFNKMKFKELSSDEDEEEGVLFGSSHHYLKKKAEESDLDDEVVSSASDSD